DKRFSGGSMYKWNTPARFSFSFHGDRAIIYSAKGRHHGKVKILMLRAGQRGSFYDNGLDDKIDIPGSDSNRVLTINLDTGKRGNEIPQYILFDTNDYFPGGLPWDRYSIAVYLAVEDIETYSTSDTFQCDSFVGRCR